MCPSSHDTVSQVLTHGDVMHFSVLFFSRYCFADSWRCSDAFQCAFLLTMCWLTEMFWCISVCFSSHDTVSQVWTHGDVVMRFSMNFFSRYVDWWRCCNAFQYEFLLTMCWLMEMLWCVSVCLSSDDVLTDGDVVMRFSDIRKMKDMRKQFEKISDDLDSALVRNSQAQRAKPQECKEALNDMTTMKRCFAHTSLDYVFEVQIQIQIQIHKYFIVSLREIEKACYQA